MTTTYADVVVLVPGFFGFSRLGDFYYFADRVAAVLRGHLESTLGRPTPVVGIATHPAGGIAGRQRDLLARLAQVEAKIAEGPTRLHLVGHSTGGVDAQLLLAEAPLSSTWSELDPTGLRQRIHSIATVSAPFYGTCLAESRAVGFLSEPSLDPRAWADTAKLLAEAGRLPLDNLLVQEALFASARHGSGVVPFLIDLLTDRSLLSDLIPANMERIQREHPVALTTEITCFVTLTPDRALPDRKPDHFFEMLHRLTGTCGASPCSAHPERLMRFEHAAGAAFDDTPLPITVSTNDGIVNSVSQLLASPSAKLGGFVVGDHADVLGHYERFDPLTDNTLINGGFFRSGANFGDDQFFELYRWVASSISRRVASG